MPLLHLQAWIVWWCPKIDKYRVCCWPRLPSHNSKSAFGVHSIICTWFMWYYQMKNDFNTRYEKILFKNGCFSVIHLGWCIDVLIDWCNSFSILPLKCGCFIDSSLFQESVWTMEPIFICLTLNGNRQKFLKETAQKPYKMNILARPIRKKESLIKFHKNVRILRQVFFLKRCHLAWV